MDTLLTLVIALGGIATGIGAIWAAVVARRRSPSAAWPSRTSVPDVDRFENQLFSSRRRAAARYLIDNVFVDDGMVEVPRLNRAGWDVCAFFEDLAHLQRLEALPAETVWNSFGSVTRTYWPLCKSAIEKMREEWEVPALYEEFQRLSRVLADLERERGIEPPTKVQLRQGAR